MTLSFNVSSQNPRISFKDVYFSFASLSWKLDNPYYPNDDLDSVWEKRGKRIEFFPKDPWCMNQEELEKHHPMSGAGCSVM